MRKDANGTYTYSPTDLVKFINSPFMAWMDRFNCDRPGVYTRDAQIMDIWQSEGYKHEAATLKLLEARFGPAINLDKLSERHEATVQAMKDGHAIIFQGELRKGEFRGYSDFLIRVDGESKLGGYHYEVWDTKLARTAKPAYAIQLCCYSEMIAEIQGKLPDHFTVFLGDGREERFRVEDYFYYYLSAKNAFMTFQKAFAEISMPIPQPWEDLGDWSDFAENTLKNLDHLSQVANITGAQIKRLEGAGIKTMRDLADAKPEQLPPKMDLSIFAKHIRQARLQLASENKERPEYEVLSLSNDTSLGLAALPPSHRNDIFFDLEGFPLAKGGLEYLWGAVSLENGKPVFKDWWAHNAVQERKAFEAFTDWIYPLWKHNPDLHIYHYGDYEISVLKRLSCRYGTREEQIDEMLRGHAFVNLYSIVRHGLCVGESGYSIKNIEKIYGQKREGTVGAAGDSIVEYHRWLLLADGPDHTSSPILKSIRDYNEDDCRSTFTLAEWLRTLQTKHGIAYRVPSSTANVSTEIRERNEEDILAEKLRAHLPEGGPTNEKERIVNLIADLLGFYSRELKPQYWAKFDRLQNKTAADLITDTDCLAQLTRTSSPPVTKGVTTTLEFEFDPEQETKFDSGADCVFHHEPRLRGKVGDFDSLNGKLTITFGGAAADYLQELPPSVCIIPDVMRLTDHLKPSIVSTAQQLIAGLPGAVQLPKCLMDYLSRRGPDTSVRTSGAPLIKQEGNRVNEAIEIVLGMNSSTLCLQGPPGTGKTYTAANMILALLKAGKRVGVTSNSHKAVDNLLRETHRLAKEGDFNFVGCTIGGSQEATAAELGFNWSKSGSEYYKAKKKQSQLVGGTVWAFASTGAVDYFDYLFVEEAGQFALAHLVAAARSTKNLVLLGDQMQLEQPMQGSHPGESGQSALQYFMQGRATMPADLGIFLPETRRLHSKICQFISGAVYENRLSSHASTDSRVITWKTSDELICNTGSGVYFHGVEHEGNSNSSDEEVAAIQSIVAQLCSSALISEASTTRPVTVADILFIAPYNMQRAKLQAIFPEARVGTVDLFQGQEAPIVILSMCSSSTELSSRGMEFLFSKNRINVAVSRAKSLAIVVGHPGLRSSRASTIEKMTLINLYCRLCSA